MVMPSPTGPLTGIFAQSLPPSFPPPVAGALAKVLQLEAVDALYANLRNQGPTETFVERLLTHLEVSADASPADLARIPRTGAAVVVSNHPFGLFDGAFLADFLPKLRPDVKVLANSMLLAVPELRERIIPVDPFGGTDATTSNVKGMRDALRWLNRGGMLVAFPAGEVSSLRLEFPHIGIEDPPWSDTIARLVRQSKACAVPLFLDGRNSALFQVAGLIHPRLRTALLPHELLNKQRTRLRVRIGQPIPAAKVASIPSDVELTGHLRWRTYLLSKRHAPKFFLPRLHRPIASPLPAQSVAAAMPSLPLLSSGDFDVYLGHGAQLGAALQEIGRLRELSFRPAGEGSGKSRDLDSFDAHYRHLILWDRARQQIAGAYRLGVVDEILPARGPAGLYTSTLFSFQPDFFLNLGPAVELGRSFIREEYQKSYQPLLLLWKGIGRFLLEHGCARTLFGPVSISASYSTASRELIAAVLQSATPSSLRELAVPRHPLRPKLAISPHCDEAEMESMVSELEVDAKPLPVLLRQYLKLGARLHAFNVDPKFQNCLDGLIVVDLARTERRLLERYFGPDGAQEFLSKNCEGALLTAGVPLHRTV
jgi:putative hemolysin